MEALVKLLDGGPVSAGTAAAVWALMELCVRNEAGQHAVLDRGGLEKVWLHQSTRSLESCICLLPGVSEVNA